MASRRRRSKRPNEVFLSYSHKDTAFIVRLANALRDHGIRVWYSKRHIAGPQWLDEIGVALERCDWILIALTPDAVRSKWVKREVTAALIDDRYDEHIVPLLVKQCRPEALAWPLAGFQRIGFKSFKEGIAELLRLWGIDDDS